LLSSYISFFEVGKDKVTDFGWIAYLSAGLRVPILIMHILKVSCKCHG
jgi:hypothetical protein